MALYKIADLITEMRCEEEPLHTQAKTYELDDIEEPQIKIRIPKDRLIQLQEKHPYFSTGRLYYIESGMQFYRDLLDFDGFCLHASAVKIGNQAILFSGPCGTGKSTHAGLWQQVFMDQAVILNDDKPAIRRADDGFFVYGTPWSGKTDLNRNQKAPLNAIVFLKQASYNKIEMLSVKESIQLLLWQSMRENQNPARMARLMSLIDALLKTTPVYRLHCTISSEAVDLVYQTIFQKNGEIK